VIRDLQIACDAPGCIRGVVRGHSAFGDPCPVCVGRGSLSLATVCTYIQENESTVRKLLRPNRRMRPKVAARICAKLVALVTPKLERQPGLFA
jgi:hypothetical protein